MAATGSLGLCSCCPLLKNGTGSLSLGRLLGGVGTSVEDPVASKNEMWCRQLILGLDTVVWSKHNW